MVGFISMYTVHVHVCIKVKYWGEGEYSPALFMIKYTLIYVYILVV